MTEFIFNISYTDNDLKVGSVEGFNDLAKLISHFAYNKKAFSICIHKEGYEHITKIKESDDSQKCQKRSISSI